MIDKVFKLLKKDIYNFLTRLPELNISSEDFIQIMPIVKFDGSIGIPDNSIGLSLVNIEEERVLRSTRTISKTPDGKVSQLNPDIKLNLFILVAVNFSIYDTGLEYLSGVIRYFQGKNVFTPDNTPELPQSIQKLIAELYTLSFEQQNHLWGSLGGKYLPSVIYKLRLITIQEGLKDAEQPQITNIKSIEKVI